MKKLLILFSLGLTFFACQKSTLLDDPQINAPAAENLVAGDRSCTLEITPLSGSGNAWFATIYGDGVVVARICGTSYNNASYTKVAYNTVFAVPGGTAYKQYRIYQENLNVTFKIQSDAGCFNLTCLGNTHNRFYAGCSTSTCSMTVQVNSTTNATGWKAEVRRINAASCTDELVTTIGGSTSGAAITIPTGSTGFVSVDGFTQVSIKQLVGNVNYTLNAPSTAWASIAPATFTVNAGSTTSKRLGCSN